MLNEYVENILAIFRESDQSEMAHGLNWYPDAKSQSHDIADETELPLHIVVGVVAALSPTNDWNQNIKDAKLFCQTFVDGGYFEDVKASTYKKMWEKAWNILSSVDDYEGTAKILNGPKITDFYRCIQGENVCVIDGHAWCIAHNDRRVLQEVPYIGKKHRQELQEAYKIAGEKAGLTAYEMQAVTWVTWKRIWGV
jgi:hypothetical protein